MVREIKFPMSGKTIRELERKKFKVKDIATLIEKDLVKGDKKTKKKFEMLGFEYKTSL